MKPLPLIINISQEILMPTAVAFSSLLRHGNESCMYDIYVLHDPTSLPTKQQQVLKKWFDGEERIHFIFVDVEKNLKNTFSTRGIPTVAYYRLFAPTLLPQLDVAIYVDVDMIFRIDFSNLINLQFKGNLVAGVKDSSCFYTHGVERIENIHANPKTYINAGFMVFNLKGMRQDESFIRQSAELIQQNFENMDQDIINLLCKDKTLNIANKYNDTNSLYQLIEKGKTSEKKTQSLEDFICNVHYTGGKPWQGICHRADLWWEEYRHSPCYDHDFYFNYYNNTKGIQSTSITELSLHLYKKIKQKVIVAIKAK